MNIISHIDCDKVRVGRLFSYEKSSHCSIYYENAAIYMNTPFLYIPHGVYYYQNSTHPILELTCENEKYDPSITTFITNIKAFELRCAELLKICHGIDVTHHKLNSLIRTVYANNVAKIMIPINKTASQCILLEYPNKRKTIISDWNIAVPTYGIAIFQIRNIWFNSDTYGINIILQNLQIMDSHILDIALSPPQPIPADITLENHTELFDKVCDNVEYAPYYKMKKMGIPAAAIKLKMQINGHNPELLEHPSNPAIQILHHHVTTSAVTQSNLASTISPLSKLPSANMLLGALGNLRKADPLKQSQPLPPPRKQHNPHGLHAPTCDQITAGLAKLRKTNKKPQ